MPAKLPKLYARARRMSTTRLSNVIWACHTHIEDILFKDACILAYIRRLGLNAFKELMADIHGEYYNHAQVSAIARGSVRWACSAVPLIRCRG